MANFGFFTHKLLNRRGIMNFNVDHWEQTHLTFHPKLIALCTAIWSSHSSRHSVSAIDRWEICFDRKISVVPVFFVTYSRHLIPGYGEYISSALKNLIKTNDIYIYYKNPTIDRTTEQVSICKLECLPNTWIIRRVRLELEERKTVQNAI